MKTLWSALLNGATLCPFDLKTRGVEALATWMKTEKITVFISVPSVFRQFARQSIEQQSNNGQSSTRNAFPDLRLVRLGGETLHRGDVGLFRRHFSPQCLLANSFSSTETGNIALFFIDEATVFEGETVPVGFIADGVEVSIVDENNRKVGFDEVGEIVVRSRYLSPGYWRNRALTQQVFQAGRSEHERLYRSGDLGSLSPDGCLQHRGRKDFQVKIRGFRVELGEVEAALKTHAAIRESVVVARPDARGENSLVAYVVAENAVETRADELRRFLSQRVPQHAIPIFYVYLESLPLTPNGKIDRAQLPAPQKIQTQHDDENADAPQDDIEKRLAQIWQKVLKVPRVERHDNFFELGGHSLLAGVLLTKIEDEFSRRLAISTLYESATVGAQAELLRHQDESPSLWPHVVALQSKGARPPIFFVHNMNDSLLPYRELVRGLGRDQPVYGLQPFEAAETQDVQSSTRTRSLEEMAALYVRDLRRFQPQGAYYLCGHSFAGTVAFEMARQLEAQGQRVALLALLDTSCRADKNRTDAPLSRQQRRRNHRHIRRHLAPRDRLIYSAHYAKMWGKRRFNSLRKRLDGPAKTAQFQRDQEQLDRVLEESSCENRAASAAYQVRPYGGRITLFRAMLSFCPRRSIELGWQSFADVRIVEVSGDHYSLLEQPHVRLLARRLKKCLEEAQQNERTTK